jgi:hypothetical protein
MRVALLVVGWLGKHEDVEIQNEELQKKEPKLVSYL